MFELLKTIGKITSRVDSSSLSLGPDTADIVTIPKPKPGLYGIPFADDILMTDYKSAMSFRVKYSNLGLQNKIHGFRARESFPQPVLKDYFMENSDNPYALMYVIGRMAVHGDATTPLTQVPPVVTNYDSRATRDQAVARLLKEAQPMDSVFSRPIQSSEVSRLIRTVDSCQFSHVGGYVGEGLTVDAGPDGVHRNSLAELAETAHVGLYRLRKPLSEEERTAGVGFLNKGVGCGYNWLGVVEVFLRKTFKLKVLVPSGSDLLFSDAFELIAYV